MTFTVAEYICPEHGRFEALVERDSRGEAPSFMECPEPADDGDADYGTCAIMAPWTISAPLGRVKLGEVTQGKVTKSEVPTWTDTEPLGDGMPLQEWKKRRAKVWKDHRYKQNVKDGRKGMA